MGSFAAQLYAQAHRDLIDGLALSGSAAFEMIAAPRESEEILASIGGAVEPRTPFDWLSRDAAEVDKYIADPLCGFSANASSLMSMFALSADTADPKRLKQIRDNLPIYVFSGEEDLAHAGLTRMHPLLDRLRDAGLKNIKTRIYPGARHEVLNETNRSEVVADLMGWLAASGNA